MKNEIAWFPGGKACLRLALGKYKIMKTIGDYRDVANLIYESFAFHSVGREKMELINKGTRLLEDGTKCDEMMRFLESLLPEAKDTNFFHYDYKKPISSRLMRY